jgi:hypothetical protein
MMPLKKLFSFTIIFIIVAISSAIILFLTGVCSQEHFKSFMLAGIIATFNAGLGIISIIVGINKPDKLFLQRFLGGMVIRFFVTLIIVVLTLAFLELNRISFIFSILFFYIFFLIIEIIYLNFSQN